MIDFYFSFSFIYFLFLLYIYNPYLVFTVLPILNNLLFYTTISCLLSWYLLLLISSNYSIISEVYHRVITVNTEYREKKEKKNLTKRKERKELLLFTYRSLIPILKFQTESGLFSTFISVGNKVVASYTKIESTPISVRISNKGVL